MTTYNLKLEFPKNRGESLIFSLPESNQYQTINNLTVTPQPKIIDEQRWGNKVAVFALNDVNKNITINFNMQCLPLSLSIKNFDIEDYKKKKFFSDRFIDGRNSEINQIAKKIIVKEKSLSQIAKKIYDYMLGFLAYSNPIDGLYTYKQALMDRKTDCGGFSTLLLSLLQSLGIPGRLVVGFLIKESFLKKLQVSSYKFRDLSMHAWAEIMLPDGSWFPMDPSIEWRRNHELTKRQGGFGIIPSDRFVVSYGEDFKIKIDNKDYQIDILQKPIYL